MSALPEHDYEVENHGSILLFRPLSYEAKERFAEVFADAQWWGGAVAVDHRMAGNLVDTLAENDGLLTSDE